ncbi:MAG: phosphohydrolase [Nanoarchaeota archaeon]
MQNKVDFEAAKKYLFARLETELSPSLFYHGVHHTRDFVLPAFERIAKLECVIGEDLIIGKTATLYHDAGYLKQYERNELVGVQIAKETLPNFGYNLPQLDRIEKIIMATQLKKVHGRLVQNPDRRDLLQMIMCDADLDHLGRMEFFDVGESLRLELVAVGGINIDFTEWNKKQLEFLENHKYFTQSAKNLRNGTKQRNITKIREILGIA